MEKIYNFCVYKLKNERSEVKFANYKNFRISCTRCFKIPSIDSKLCFKERYRPLRVSEKDFGIPFREDSKNDIYKRNTNHNIITVTNKKTKVEVFFDFWTSIARPYILSTVELLESFDCFIGDAILGILSFDEFCSELGYSNDSIEAQKIHNKCKESSIAAMKVLDENIYDFASSLREHIDKRHDNKEIKEKRTEDKKLEELENENQKA